LSVHVLTPLIHFRSNRHRSGRGSFETGKYSCSVSIREAFERSTAGALPARGRISSRGGNRQVHYSAAAHFPQDIEAAADAFRALAHAHQAEVSRPLVPADRRVNALPVVSHAHT